MSAKNLTSALEKTVAALLPLAPEERRRVLEAVHALIEIGSGQARGEGGGKPPSGAAARPRGRR